ncbi:VOC family protein [Mycobacterium lentiflavum]|uniref:VOC family protein n=1 Tax=Mycobacterium lentiflavum TaxID=141349 RepID=UPI00158693F0|nr:VOC family protein [Mycobacterium lentiflavum]
MSPPVQCLNMQHINFVARDFDATVEHFEKLLGAQFVLDLPSDQWHAGLLYTAGVLFELFSPNEYLLNARYGAHYLGLEYEVADLDDTRRRLRVHGIDLVRDIGAAIHTEPSQCFGVALEFFQGNFHRDGIVDWKEPLHPVDHWRTKHPLGLTGLSHYNVVVAKHQEALDFYRNVLAAAVIDQSERRQIGAQVTRLRLADTQIELMSPLGPGPILEQLHRYGDGMRSVALCVEDLASAAEQLSRWDIPFGPGDGDRSIAIDPRSNRGLLMELTDRKPRCRCEVEQRETRSAAPI